MRVPLSWLRDFAPFEGDPVALGETFDDLGMVVEGLERVGEGLDGVVVARVVDIQPIKKADRIRQVLVDAGGPEPVQVVCGAFNFDVGAVVPFATVGAVLPGDFEITERRMRGVASYGMICSAAELRLGDDAAGIMVLPDSLAVGAPVAEALGIESDVVYDLAIEGNRPDANSVAGVARDAAARLGLPFSIPDRPVAEGPTPVSSLATVVVESPDLCPRFTARVVDAVTVGPSPEWVARRLTLAGMRPINNVVDASNYVMLELGQPTHPYDLDRLPGQGLLVRAARPGETLVTLDGVERRLGDGDDCLICDAEGTPVGIGGIMGGSSSEIADHTTRVLLEAAYFTPMAIARTSKRIGLRTEASARFERGCDPWGIEQSVARFLSVLGVGDVAAGMLDVNVVPPSREMIRVRPERVNAILGTSLAPDEMARYLRPIGFTVEGELEVVPPSFRPDVTTEIEVIEEVARHHGYASIARTVPRSPFVGALTPYQRARRLLKEVLVGAGVSEALFSPLLAPGDHERAGLSGEAMLAADPLAREESVLRTSLLPGLLKAAAFNASHRNPDVSLFEVGHVFGVPADRSQPLPDEREIVAVMVADAVAAKRVLDLVLDAFHRHDIRLEAAEAPGLHPTRTARLAAADGATVGWVGEVDPAVCQAFDVPGPVGWIEADLALLLPTERTYVQSQSVSKQPSSDIDLAFVVPDSVAAAAVEATLREAGGELLVDLRLFDVFRGGQLPPDSRSLAYRLRFQALDRTLTEADLADVRTRCIDAVTTTHPAHLR